MIANPFASQSAARRYAAGRPDYSPHAAEAIRQLTRRRSPVRLALDVGCGTGLSARALAPFAERVVGVEQSPAMLGHASAPANGWFAVARAEQIPLAPGCCGLIGIGSALHWFDQAPFLAELDRVGRDDADLVVFDHWFTGTIRGCRGFADWFQDYLERYPSPPRDGSWSPPHDLGSWSFVGMSRYDHAVAMTADMFSCYLLSQSNVQAAADVGQHGEAELRRWLLEELEVFFQPGAAPVVEFRGMVAHLVH
jgi:SAM-dependent methyltransferase